MSDYMVAYKYQGENLCPVCTADRVGYDNNAEYDPPRSPDGFIEAVAVMRKINRDDESSFDSDQFPKIVFASMVKPGECCGNCDELLSD